MLATLTRIFRQFVLGESDSPACNVNTTSPQNRPSKTAIADIEYMSSSAVATLTVTELVDEHGAAMLAELLDEMANSGSQHFVLDLQNVQHMDSRCLGSLVEATNRLAASGGRIALVNPAHTVQYLFRLTRLDRVFPICHDVLAALAAVERTGREEAA